MLWTSFLYIWIISITSDVVWSVGRFCLWAIVRLKGHSRLQYNRIIHDMISLVLTFALTHDTFSQKIFIRNLCLSVKKRVSGNLGNLFSYAPACYPLKYNGGWIGFFLLQEKIVSVACLRGSGLNFIYHWNAHFCIKSRSWSRSAADIKGSSTI